MDKTINDEYMELRRAALKLSQALHRFERQGGKTPTYIDHAWETLTVALEASKPVN